MEDSTEQNNPEPVKDKSSYWRAFKHGAIVVLSIIVIIAIGISYLNHQAKLKEIQAQELLDKQNAVYQKNHAAFVVDSIAKAEVIKKEFLSMKFTLHVYDSAKNSLRYQVGDIVYIKPDSIVAVIKHIQSDSLLYYYSYVLVVSNKDGNETMCERTDKMLY